MFIIRQIRIEDVPAVLKLARLVHSFNLPADRDSIATKVQRSRRSFSGRLEDPKERLHMFVLEDTETGNIIGTSMIIGCISTPGQPHVYLEVSKKSFWSDDLQQGQTHKVLKLGTDETGPSELAGLILAPGYRGHRDRLGGFLSSIRFHYLGLHRRSFDKRVIAEVMGSLTPDSRNVLWDYLGGRFINLSYLEADVFCQHSKEFITSLFPTDPIYASLLPPEARNLIGRVGDEARPALAMLERQGFEYHGHIDPFDGGPYLEARLDRIPLVKETSRVKVVDTGRVSSSRTGILSVEGPSLPDGPGAFRAVQAPYAEVDGGIQVARKTIQALGIKVGDKVGLTPIRVPVAKPEKDGGSRKGKKQGKTAKGNKGAKGKKRSGS
ncbi:MAG: arginine N-succinyltransferase [Planctomycetaceae bacterium]|nr:arginine N-succinyltransferase [Planctomycetaceae bacterium]